MPLLHWLSDCCRSCTATSDIHSETNRWQQGVMRVRTVVGQHAMLAFKGNTYMQAEETSQDCQGGLEICVPWKCLSWHLNPIVQGFWGGAPASHHSESGVLLREVRGPDTTRGPSPDPSLTDILTPDFHSPQWLETNVYYCYPELRQSPRVREIRNEVLMEISRENSQQRQRKEWGQPKNCTYIRDPVPQDEGLYYTYMMSSSCKRCTSQASWCLSPRKF